jgi:hypothetical protein
MSQFNQQFIKVIIDRYGLELDDDRAENIVVTWLQKYDSVWIVKAIVESLHRGRYKVKSVDSILSGWQRVGKPSYQFTPEFEREILQNLSENPDPPQEALPPKLSSPTPEFPVTQLMAIDTKDLNPEESTPFQHHNHATPIVQSAISQREPIVVKEDRRNSVTTQPRFLAIFQGGNFASSNDHREIITAGIISQPAKFQLFRTLQSIVDPNDSQSRKTIDPTEPSNLICSQLATEEHLPSITDFEFSLGNASAE